MPEPCSIDSCTEVAVASVEDVALCYRHFLTRSYERLEAVAAQIQDPQFHIRHAEATGRFLEDCMRNAVDVASAVKSPTNLERARLLDILLWASELHGQLRRGPRVPARIAILLRSDVQDRSWEAKAETRLLSRHGAQIVCRHEASTGDQLTCTRLDSGARATAQVVWVRRQGAGEVEMGIEFLGDVNFWNFGSSPSSMLVPIATATGNP